MAAREPSNALKYSPDNSPVSLEFGCVSDRLSVKIRDQGLGIPKVDMPQIFKTFFRAGNVEHIHGTGLGLAIVKQAVDILKGTISYQSNVDAGTVFEVLLPITLKPS